MTDRILNWPWVPRNNRLLVAAGMALVAALGVGTGYVSLRLPREDYIHREVLLEGQSVGGFTRAQARAIVERETARALSHEVTLKAHGQQWTFSRKQLGALPQIDEAIDRAYRVGRTGPWIERAKVALAPAARAWDIRVRYTFDSSVMKAVLTGLEDQVRIPAQDAWAQLREGVVRIEPGQWGESLDLDNSCGKLEEALAEPQQTTKVDLILNSRKPRVTYEELKHLDCVLAEYQTPFNPSKKDRTHNLRLAGACIDKVLLRPGETFSYNDMVGPRLKSKGYRAAPIFSDGEVVEDVGGGVCQVATTLYNVALLSGIRIVQRRPHSQPVTYCPPGRDATVYFGQTDLRFRNSTSLPIYFRTSVSGSRVRVMAMGSRLQKRQVELLPLDRETTPYKEIEKPDPSLPAGKKVEEQSGRAGIRLSLRRIVKHSDKIIANELVSRDYYRPQDRVIRVGPASTPTSEPPKPQASQPAAAAAQTATKGQAAASAKTPRVEDLPTE